VKVEIKRRGPMEYAEVELSGTRLVIYDCNIADTTVRSHVVVYQKDSDQEPKQVLEIVTSGMTGIYHKTRLLKPPKKWRS
jgi:hypothetical protein